MIFFFNQILKRLLLQVALTGILSIDQLPLAAEYFASFKVLDLIFTVILLLLLRLIL